MDMLVIFHVQNTNVKLKLQLAEKGHETEIGYSSHPPPTACL